MTPPDPDLDDLTALLGRCLGRIDEQAFRLQEPGDDGQLFLAGDLLEHEAEALQELLQSLLAADERAVTDVNATVARVVAAWIEELGVPIVLRQRFAPSLPPAGCAAGPLTGAVQRALVLATDRVEPGAELCVTTRAEDGGVVLEIESHGRDLAAWTPDRAETLCDFVDGFGGQCRIDGHRDGLFVAIELPRALAADER